MDPRYPGLYPMFGNYQEDPELLPEEKDETVVPKPTATVAPYPVGPVQGPLSNAPTQPSETISKYSLGPFQGPVSNSPVVDGTPQAPATDSPEDLAVKNALNSQLAGIGRAEKETPQAPVDFGSNQVGGRQKLEDLQQQVADERKGVDLRRNINMVTAGMLRTDPTDADYFDKQAKAAGQPIEDYEAQIKNQKNDPNSTYSKGLKGYLDKLGFKINGNPSGDDLEKIVPLAVKQFEAKEARTARRDDLKLKLAELNQRMATTRDEKKKVNEAHAAEKLDKRLSDASNRISGELARTNTSLGKASQVKFAADRIQGLVDASGGDLNKLDSRQVYEIATALDSLISQGSSTVSGRQHLIPKTAIKDAKSIAEYITNTRQGANSGKFVKSMLDTVKREKQIADKMQKDAATKILSGYPDIQRHPDYSKMLKSHGIGDQEDPTEGKVRVQHPDGRKGFIPKEQVETAAKQGFKVIQ